jgi:hypothetical protein
MVQMNQMSLFGADKVSGAEQAKVREGCSSKVEIVLIEYKRYIDRDDMMDD